jgi:hypothetical protein
MLEIIYQNYFTVIHIMVCISADILFRNIDRGKKKMFYVFYEFHITLIHISCEKGLMYNIFPNN